MPCVCQYEYTNIVPSNGTKIVRLGYLFTYVDEVLDMQGEAESSIFSISYPVTHVAPILGRTLSAVLGLAGLVAVGWWMRRRQTKQQALERAQDMADRCIEAHRTRCDEGMIDAFPLSMLAEPVTHAPIRPRDLWRISEQTEPSSYSSKCETRTSNRLTE